MSSYLHVAEIVLRDARRPMSARAILKKAYTDGLAPYHLYGKTQHKTLQARLSEDILHRREHSVFFRTSPGQFFLREFLTDTSIPSEYRVPVVARRRTRDLLRGPALSIPVARVCEELGAGNRLDADLIANFAREGAFRYVDPKQSSDEDALVWAVSALTRPGEILSYRIGRYRDDRDHFTHKRSIAFTSLVLEEDRTLFHLDTLGIEESAIVAVATDLDMPLPEALRGDASMEHRLRFAALESGEAEYNIIVYVEIVAPSWFEPIVSRLSLNDLGWMDLTRPPNNMDDFDPWSRQILSYYFPQLSVNSCA